MTYVRYSPLSDSAGFWASARSIQASLLADEVEEEPLLDPEQVSMVDWAEARSKLGISDSGDVIGHPSWTRPTQIMPPPLTSPMDDHAATREQLGIHDAPQASADNPRTHTSAYRT